MPLLVPTLARRLGDRVTPASPGAAVGWKPAGAVVLLVALVPLLAVAVARPQLSPENVVLTDDGGNTLLLPVDRSIDVRAVKRGATTVLTWSPGDWRAGVSFRVMRTAGTGSDTTCTTAGVTSCLLVMETLKETRESRYADRASPAVATYRIGVMADYRNPPVGGDMFAVSQPVRIAP